LCPFGCFVMYLFSTGNAMQCSILDLNASHRTDLHRRWARGKHVSGFSLALRMFVVDISTIFFSFICFTGPLRLVPDSSVVLLACSRFDERPARKRSSMLFTVWEDYFLSCLCIALSNIAVVLVICFAWQMSVCYVLVPRSWG